MSPDDVDMTDPGARACWGQPTITPERLAAWEQWNTTAAEVIEVLRAAAVIEESREAQAIIAAASEVDVRVVSA